MPKDLINKYKNMEDAQKIKELREATGASVLDCRNILDEMNGDVEKAKIKLAEKGKAKVEKKAGRAMSEGAIESYIHSNGKIGVIVELSCETDFVAKNEKFLELAHNIAMHIAAANPLCVDSPELHPEIAGVIEEEKKKVMEEFAGKKSQEMIGNIVAGKIKKYTDSVTLIKQAYVKDPEKTIEDLVAEAIAKLGENIKVKRFCRLQID